MIRPRFSSILLGMTALSTASTALIPDGFMLAALSSIGKHCNVFVHCLDQDWQVLQRLHGASSSIVCLENHPDEASLDEILTAPHSFCNVVFASFEDDAGLEATEQAFWKAKDIVMFADVAPTVVPRPKRMSTFVVQTGNNGSSSFLHHYCPKQGYVGRTNWWSASSGLAVTAPGWSRCGNTLNGLHINVAVTGFPPWTTYDAHGAISGGADLDLLDITAAKLNFTYDMSYSPIWGQVADSGVWQGVVGSVYNETAVIGIGHFLIEYYYQQVVESPHFLYPEDLVIFAPKPTPVLPFLNVLEPFSLSVWIWVVVMVLSVSFVIFLLMIEAMVVKKRKYRLTFLISNPLMETIGTLLNQSDTVYRNFDRPPKELLLWFWLIGDFFIKSFYSSLLFAHLIKTVYTPPIDSIDDVVAQDKRLWLIAGTPFITFFEASTLPAYKYIYNQIIKENLVAETYQGLFDYNFEKQLIARGDCFLLTYPMGLYMYKAEAARWGEQPYRIAKEVAFPFFGSTITQKNAPHLLDMDDINARLVASGIPNELINDQIDPQFLLPVKEEDPPPAPLTIFHILGALCCLGLLLPIALVLFITEVTHKHAKKAVKGRRVSENNINKQLVMGQPPFGRYYM